MTEQSTEVDLDTPGVPFEDVLEHFKAVSGRTWSDAVGGQAVLRAENEVLRKAAKDARVQRDAAIAALASAQRDLGERDDLIRRMRGANADLLHRVTDAHPVVEEDGTLVEPIHVTMTDAAAVGDQ